ncbi:Uncharacterised protein [Serratia marcescens]|uniref:Uncharacterized protein n=1 Tax=Serratia marcescens TaxID=615 RepID=A0A380A208_SERMA|nr:Uncharacterised protein [Serratia marcescens]
MDVIDRLWSWVIYSYSTVLMGIGMMTQREWLATGGLVIGLIAAALGEIHRRRVARSQATTNALLAQLVDAVRSDAENRQDVKALISELKRGPTVRRKSVIACSVAAIVALAGALWPEKGAHQPGGTVKNGEV